MSNLEECWSDDQSDNKELWNKFTDEKDLELSDSFESILLFRFKSLSKSSRPQSKILLFETLTMKLSQT